MTDTQHPSRALHIRHDRLRIAIGVLGVTLPLLLIWGAHERQTSISDYYFSNMRDYFEGVLFFLAMFLFAYRPSFSDGWKDNWITNFAGLFSLILALFPTLNVTYEHIQKELVLSFVPWSWSGQIHNAGSAGLFVCFAVLSLFFFTRGPKDERTFRKAVRNAFYILLGLGICVCIAIIGWGAFTAPDQTARDKMDILIPEAAALVCFGLSWLIKGGAFPFLNDRK